MVRHGFNGLSCKLNKLGWEKGSFPITEKQSSEILTLPVNQFLKLDDIKIITKAVNAWEAH